jgi:diguanylate cyclase
VGDDNSRRQWPAYIRKDGKTVWARTTVNVIRDQFGRPLPTIAAIQDLNARKQMERDLEASKDRLQFALNAALLGCGSTIRSTAVFRRRPL